METVLRVIGEMYYDDCVYSATEVEEECLYQHLHIIHYVSVMCYVTITADFKKLQKNKKSKA